MLPLKTEADLEILGPSEMEKLPYKVFYIFFEGIKYNLF